MEKHDPVSPEFLAKAEAVTANVVEDSQALNVEDILLPVVVKCN